MKRFSRLLGLIFLSALFLSSGFALAQSNLPLSAQEPVGENLREGARGRYSQAQGEQFALDYLPGEVVDSGLYRQHNRVFFYYVILRPDGSVFRLDVSAVSGEVVRVRVDELSDRPQLPRNVISTDAAVMFARAYVEQRTQGRMPVTVEGGANVGEYNNALVYVVNSRKGTRRYRSFVDAFKGDVLANEEIK